MIITKSRGQGDGAPGKRWVFEIRAFLNWGMCKRHGLYTLESKVLGARFKIFWSSKKDCHRHN